MCLFSKKRTWLPLFLIRKFPRLLFKKAKKDIKVVKYLCPEGNGNYRTPYVGMKVTFGKLYYSKFGISRTRFNDNIIIVKEGLHSYTKSDEYAVTDRPLEKFNAIIPKGSLYLEGLEDDIVSNALIVLKN